MGWLARQYGLSCDNVASFEMVTADGTLVRASEAENPALFWASAAAVGTSGSSPSSSSGCTRPVPALSAPISSSTSRTRCPYFAARRSCRPTRCWPLASLGFVWMGDPDEGRRLVPSLQSLGRPVAERIEVLSYLQLQTIDDSVEGYSLRRYWRGHYFSAFGDEAIEAYLLRGSQDGHGEHLPKVSLRAYGGAISDRSNADTAFSQRDALLEFVAASGWSDPAEDEARIAAARRTAAALEPFASGAYVNTLSDEGARGVSRAYSPDKLARLTALKDAYDPANVFHLNQNIRPSSA
jgi:hypothetical protein